MTSLCIKEAEKRWTKSCQKIHLKIMNREIRKDWMKTGNKITTCVLLTTLASKVVSGTNIQWQTLAKGEGVGVGMGEGGG